MKTTYSRWDDAIIRVLGDANTDLHYKEVTKRILDQGLYKTKGKTPENSVNRNLSQNTNYFVRTTDGCYKLSADGVAEYRRIMSEIHYCPLLRDSSDVQHINI